MHTGVRPPLNLFALLRCPAFLQQRLRLSLQRPGAGTQCRGGSIERIWIRCGAARPKDLSQLRRGGRVEVQSLIDRLAIEPATTGLRRGLGRGRALG